LKEDYTIDELIETFQIHMKEYIKQEAEFDKKYPDREKFGGDFCICAALLSMCKEINTIKDRLDFMDL
jgi:hypothetical protein